jgi:magnesium-transporting ATPase (P-type)
MDEVHGLSIDTSTLTGESVPVTPQVGQSVLAGTFAVEGEGIGRVTATGRWTRLAQIAQLTAAKPRPVTPLTLELNRVVRVIAMVCLSVGSIFLAIALLVGIQLTDAFLFALGVTVALVPEGLLPTVSLSLAMGARKMAARGALVRRLESVETLGSTTFICTDKTGTLTRNEMSGVADAIAACRRAGIRVAMVTGDHRDTARAIAREVGLWTSDGVLVEGRELPAEDEVLGALLDRDGVVVSRVSPEQKLRIALALRRRGHVVAMTGDGVNDAPALHEADIGVAMGLSGTDVAREAADLVLLDDNFATIVAAVEQGRTTFANARRFLTYHLTDNVAELTPFVVWALSGGRFPLALGVLQVLCLDIGTDILPAVALGAEPSSGRALAQRPLGRHLVDRVLLLRSLLVLGLTESAIEMIAFLLTLSSEGWRPGTPFPSGAPLLVASGAAFTSVVAGQMANAFACRSATVSPRQLGWFSNRSLVVAVVCEALLLAGFLYLPTGYVFPAVADGDHQQACGLIVPL